MFLLGFFWKRTTSQAALFATVGGFLLSLFLKFLPLVAELSFLGPSGFAVKNEKGLYEIPFLDRMAIVFVLCLIGMYFISRYGKKDIAAKTMVVDKKMLRASPGFIAGALIVCGVLVAVYMMFW